MRVTIEVNDAVVSEVGVPKALHQVVNAIAKFRKIDPSVVNVTSENKYSFTLEGPTYVQVALYADSPKEFQKKIHCIKIVREHFGHGLKESKDFVDQAEYGRKVIIGKLLPHQYTAFKLALSEANVGYRCTEA